MADASHRMAKPAPQSVALYLPLISHTGSLPSARTAGWEPARLALLRTLFWREVGFITLFQGISLVINPKPGQFIERRTPFGVRIVSTRIQLVPRTD